MLYLYGDSHVDRSFKNIQIPHKNCHEPSITMFRIGRDNQIINFNNNEHDVNSVICISYGEVDCRCHVKRQIILNREEDEIIHELVVKYINTIKSNVRLYKKLIIIAVPPPAREKDHEIVHGPLTSEFPFVGTDEERVRFTKKMNMILKQQCFREGIIYFDPFDHYTREDGTLKYELSDTSVHIGNNTHYLKMFMELYNS